MSFFVCFISPYRYAEDWTSCHWLEHGEFLYTFFELHFLVKPFYFAYVSVIEYEIFLAL
jgi:hypothetical protein